MIDVRLAITDIPFIGTPFIGNDDRRISIEKHACGSEKAKVSRERRVAIQKSALIQFQKLRANRAANDDGDVLAHLCGNLLCRRRGVQHHAGEWITGIAKQAGGECGITSSADREEAAWRQVRWKW